MNTLKLVPDSTSYSYALGNNVISVNLGGGASRYRRSVLGSNHTVAVSWVLTRSQYDYLLAFYRAATQFGSTPFLVSLIIETSGLTSHKAYFKEPPSLSSVQGDIFTVSSMLEVSPVDTTDIDFLLLEFAGSFCEDEDIINNIINYRLAT